MTVRGLIAFTSYILTIYYRWARVTVRRFGLRGVVDSSYRPRHAGVGRGTWKGRGFDNQHHVDRGIRVAHLIDYLQVERAALA